MRPQQNSYKIFLLISIGLIVALALLLNDSMILIFPLFLLIWMFFPNHVEEADWSKNKSFIFYLIIGTIVGLITELFAILNNLSKPPEERILFHPDPAINIVLAIFYYFPIFFFAAIILHKYKMTEINVFLIGGIYGICTEQMFQILLSFNLILWFYVFLVYGSFITIPYTIFKNRLNNFDLKEINKLKSMIILFIALLLGFIGAFLLMGIAWILLGLPLV